MAKATNPDQIDLFDEWDSVITIPSPVGNTAEIAETNKSESNSLDIDKSRFQLALRLADKLDADGEITAKFLTEQANSKFGGKQAEGAYSPKDAYDALEAAFNIHLSRTEKSGLNNQSGTWASSKAAELTTRIQKIPTQTRRDPEMDEFQQFSTPPALAFVANWVAEIDNSDVVLEPSAGTGDLAIWAKLSDAEIVLNELAPRRQTLLSELFPQVKLFKENAEQLDNVLPNEIKPSVVVMNPPFSSTAGRVQGQRDTTNGARHIEQALKRLQDGGRLVAIVGQGMAADRHAFKDWWKAIESRYTVRANIGISGRDYAKYGTAFDNQILVIDKCGATTQPILTGYVESVAELPNLLEGIKHDRQHRKSSTHQPTGDADTPKTSDSLQPGDGVGGIDADSDGLESGAIGYPGDHRPQSIDSPIVDAPPIGDVINDGGGTMHDVFLAGKGTRNPKLISFVCIQHMTNFAANSVIRVNWVV